MDIYIQSLLLKCRCLHLTLRRPRQSFVVDSKIRRLCGHDPAGTTLKRGEAVVHRLLGEGPRALPV
jgi:hypothetical protein